MFEQTKVFLNRIICAFFGREIFVDTNTQNNYANGNQQHIYQGTVIQAQTVQFRSGQGMTIHNDEILNAHQIIALEKLLDAVVTICKVSGENKDREYLAKKLAEIAKVDDWRKMPALMYDRSVRYLMKCVGFVAIENTTTQS